MLIWCNFELLCSVLVGSFSDFPYLFQSVLCGKPWGSLGTLCWNRSLKGKELKSSSCSAMLDAGGDSFQGGVVRGQQKTATRFVSFRWKHMVYRCKCVETRITRFNEVQEKSNRTAEGENKVLHTC
jgi:hypothetical protein